LRINNPSDEAISASIDKNMSVDIADNDDKSEASLSDQDSLCATDEEISSKLINAPGNEVSGHNKITQVPLLHDKTLALSARGPIGTVGKITEKEKGTLKPFSLARGSPTVPMEPDCQNAAEESIEDSGTQYNINEGNNDQEFYNEDSNQSSASGSSGSSSLTFPEREKGGRLEQGILRQHNNRSRKTEVENAEVVNPPPLRKSLRISNNSHSANSPTHLPSSLKKSTGIVGQTGLQDEDLTVLAETNKIKN